MLDEDEDTGKDCRLRDLKTNKEMLSNGRAHNAEEQALVKQNSTEDKCNVAGEENKEKEELKKEEICGKANGIDKQEEGEEEIKLQGEELANDGNDDEEYCGDEDRRTEKAGGEDEMKELDGLSVQRDKDGVELGEPLIRKQAEWSFANRLLDEQMEEASSSTKLSAEETPHVLLKVHEGIPAKSPFTLSPKQMVSNL